MLALNERVHAVSVLQQCVTQRKEKRERKETMETRDVRERREKLTSALPFPIELDMLPFMEGGSDGMSVE